MRINKKKFCVRMFILISVIGLLIYGRFLATHDEERENLFNYYEDFISSFKNKSSTYAVAEKMLSIAIDKTQKNSIIGKNTGVLLINNNSIKEFCYSTNPIWNQEIHITNPIVKVANEWFAISEENGKKVTVFNDKNEIYNVEIDGEIQKIFVNSSGYVGVIFAKVGYKNAFAYINPNGEIIYTKYFANTTLIDADISEDGKKVVMIEADVNGAVVNSAITILDNNANVLNSSIKKNTLLVKAHLVDNKLVVVGDSAIFNVDSNYKEEVFEELDVESVIGLAVNDKKIVKLYRDTNELFANKTMVEIKNLDGKIIGQGEVVGIAHSLQIQDNTIAVVLADRIDFLTKKGHYISSIFISSDYKDVQLFNNGNYACIQTNDEIAIYKIR
jgi:hypothetical protein